MQSVANLFVKNKKFGDERKSMELEKIKCVILDFDNTMYSYGDWTRGDALTEEFLKEQKILPGVENKLEELKKIYPDLHLYQRVFAYFRDNGLDDGVYRKFNNERIPDIRTKDTVFIKPEIIEKISKKYKLFMISDSFLSYLLYYLELNKIDKDWFDGIYQNNYEDDEKMDNKNLNTYDEIFEKAHKYVVIRDRIDAIHQELLNKIDSPDIKEKIIKIEEIML